MRTVFEWEIALYVCTFFLRLVTTFDFAWTLKSGGVGGSLGGRLNAINTLHPRLRLPSIPNKEFKQWRQRRQWERQKKKTVGLDWQNRQLCTCITLSYTSCEIMCLYFTFCRGLEHKTTIFLCFSWTLIQSFRIQLQRNLPTFEELNVRDGISAIKFHAARINIFLRDVFVAVAVVVA